MAEGIEVFFRSQGEGRGDQGHMVNVELRDYTMEEFPVLCRVTCKGLWDPALSTPKARANWARLTELDQWMWETSEDYQDMVLLGRVARDGMATYYFHLKAEPFVLKGPVMGRWAECEIRYAQDPGRKVVSAEVMPTDREMQSIANGHKVRHLAKKGDDSESERQVLHLVGFRVHLNASAFVREAQARGWDAEILEEQEGMFLTGVTLVHTCSKDDVDEASWGVRELGVRHKGVYVQWACDPVIKHKGWLSRLMFWR